MQNCGENGAAERMCRRKLAGLSEPKWRFSSPLWALGIPWRLSSEPTFAARGGLLAELVDFAAAANSLRGSVGGDGDLQRINSRLQGLVVGFEGISRAVLVPISVAVDLPGRSNIQFELAPRADLEIQSSFRTRGSAQVLLGV